MIYFLEKIEFKEKKTINHRDVIHRAKIRKEKNS